MSRTLRYSSVLLIAVMMGALLLTAHPVQPNLYYKTAYYQLTQGSDGIQYIVCSGNYKRCD